MATDKKIETVERRREKEKAAFEEELTTIEGKLNRLRVLYDQYFMGVERLEPLSPRNDLDKAFLRSKLPRARSTILKFRYRSLQQRYTTLKSYWDRIVRMIEDGKIKRGIVGRPETGAFGSVNELGERPERDVRPDSLASRRRRFKRRIDPDEDPAAAPPPPPENTLYRPEQAREIYEALKHRKSAAGEAVERLSPETVDRSIRKIMEKLPDRELRLKVVNRKGKVSLVAVPVKIRKKGES